MKQFMLDQASKGYYADWAAHNGWEILDCSSPKSPASHEYAQKHGGQVVSDPRGRKDRVLIVRALPKK